jgi:hypothetical protein
MEARVRTRAIDFKMEFEEMKQKHYPKYKKGYNSKSPDGTERWLINCTTQEFVARLKFLRINSWR